MNEAQYLTEVRHLVDNHFTTLASARNAKGEVVFSGSPEAVSFCVLGAMSRIAGERDVPSFVARGARLAIDKTVRSVFGRELSVAHVNDIYGQEAVLSVLDKTIRRLNGEED